MNADRRSVYTFLSKELNNNVFYYFDDPALTPSCWELIYERYLNLEEQAYHHSLHPNRAREYLISRITLKDAVRKFLQNSNSKSLIPPNKISVRHNEKGKPCLYGHQKLSGIEISIAHKGTEAVVMVLNKPVGIDIEKIEPRSTSFSTIAFTPYELKLLKEQENLPEWVTRFWVTKEAYGKMLGVGLQGNPKQYEIESINKDELKIKDTAIKTTLHRNNFIVGWTQK